MWPFKKGHHHTWVEVDKRVFKQPMIRAKTGKDFLVEGVATLHKCSGCGEERAHMEPIEHEWWMGGLRDHFGYVDPFWYRDHFNIGGK